MMTNIFLKAFIIQKTMIIHKLAIKPPSTVVVDMAIKSSKEQIYRVTSNL